VSYQPAISQNPHPLRVLSFLDLVMSMNRLTRFSLREILWMTVVIGLALGWWLDHRRLTWQVDRADDAVEALLAGQHEYRRLLDRHAPEWRRSPRYVEPPTLEETREYYGR
jgi:hypothetical protein